MAGDYVRRRRTETNARLDQLRSKLTAAEEQARGKACVYVTGSFGRTEAGRHSDLDLFIAGRTTDAPGSDTGRQKRRALPRLEEICIKADLIEANRELGIPAFSGDGEYLEHYTVDDLIKSLGRPEDDVRNTFTARLLLLLESRPLFGEDVYDEALNDVIAAYWGDFEDHRNAFVPAFLANDILRLWRTFCVNYEARTKREPDERKAKRRLKNYKLKHSRLLTCYSAIAYLLAIFAERRTVAPPDAYQLARLTPTERLQALVTQFGVDGSLVDEIIQLYETFLENTDRPEDELKEVFLNQAKTTQLSNEAATFGDRVARLIQNVGKGSSLYRLILV